MCALLSVAVGVQANKEEDEDFTFFFDHVSQNFLPPVTHHQAIYFICLLDKRHWTTPNNTNLIQTYLSIHSK